MKVRTLLGLYECIDQYQTHVLTSHFLAGVPLTELLLRLEAINTQEA